MRFTAKVYKTSDVSVAITLPKEITDKLKIKAGDVEEFKIYKGESELPKWMKPAKESEAKIKS